MCKKSLSGLIVFVALCSYAAAADSHKQQTTVCTFDDGKQISIQYSSAPTDKKLPNGSIWTPGDQPIYLFTQTELQTGASTLPAKAYRVFLIPGKDNWTLLVNDEVSKDADYSKDHDVARISMDTGKLSATEKQFQMALGHTGPKQCSVRLYYGSTGAFATLEEK